MQLSTLIGKPVLTPAGEERGYVLAANLSRNLSKLACLICADGEEEEFFLPASAISAISDAVIAKGANMEQQSGVPSPIGRAAYTAGGTLLGVVSDVLLSEGAETVLIVTGEHALTQIPAASAAIGDRVIVHPKEAPRPKRAPKKRPQTKKEAPMSEDKAQNLKIPVRTELLSGTDLLGKIVRRTVFDERGGVIATAGEKVTLAVLSRARRKNRLVRLAVNTLTGTVTTDTSP